MSNSKYNKHNFPIAKRYSSPHNESLTETLVSSTHSQFNFIPPSGNKDC